MLPESSTRHLKNTFQVFTEGDGSGDIPPCAVHLKFFFDHLIPFCGFRIAHRKFACYCVSNLCHKVLQFPCTQNGSYFPKACPSWDLVNNLLILALPILELQTIEITGLGTWKLLDKFRCFCTSFYVWILLIMARHGHVFKAETEMGSLAS